MLKNLRINNFKCLCPATFRFAPINLFIGPNSSGKSTALQAIEMLHAIISPSIGDYFKAKGWDFRDLTHKRNTKSTMSWAAEFLITLPGQEDASTYEYRVELQPKRYLGIGEESLKVTHPGKNPIPLVDRNGRQTRVWDEAASRWIEVSLVSHVSSVMALIQHQKRFESLYWFKSELERFQAFLLWDPKDLKRRHQGIAERIGPSGEQLPGFLAYLQKKEPDQAKELFAMLVKLFPRLKAIRSTGKSGWAWHHLLISERIDASVIDYPAEHASDGFLRMLAVFALKFYPKPPKFITLEEPENGIHPHLITEVVGHLKNLASRKEPNKVQIFMSSHSPYVLNEFADMPESVHIFEKGRNDSIPRIIPLTEKMQVLRATKALGRSLGDLWYSNMLGGGAL